MKAVAEKVRLQKVLATAGLGSRRKCEQLIEAGRVSVNGQVANRQGIKVDPSTAVIHVDGTRLVVAPDVSVWALHKPVGYLSAMSDDRGRLCLRELLADSFGPAPVDAPDLFDAFASSGLSPDPGRLFHVGRLDRDSEGLLLLTNDGELAHRLAHPGFGVAKTYVAQVVPRLRQTELRKLAAGVEIDDRRLEIEKLRIVADNGGQTTVQLTIHEGRNRIIRRVFASLEHPVVRLVRVSFGPIKLGRLTPGQLRKLSSSELDALYTAAELPTREQPT